GPIVNSAADPVERIGVNHKYALGVLSAGLRIICGCHFRLRRREQLVQQAETGIDHPTARLR
ncbi:hypothetical protein SB786_37225, partial [Burkholderia sp. SIMBA_062]